MSFVGRSRTWLWALGSLLIVVLVVGSAYVAHHAVVNALAVSPTITPTAPPPEVVAATMPGPSYELLAQDSNAGHIVALTSAAQPICPPIGLCPPPAPLNTFVVLDGASGAILHQTPLSGSAASAAASVLLLVDEQNHIAYAVAPNSVTSFSTATGAYLGNYELPAFIHWQRETGGSYDPQNHTLILAGDGELVTLDVATGQPRAQRALALPAGTPLDGPVFDSAAGMIYLLPRGTPTTGPTLLAFDATTLQLVAQKPVPDAVGLGPLTSNGLSLALYEQNGAVALQPTLPSVTGSTQMTMTLPAAQPAPELAGAMALAWTTVNGHVYVARATGLDVRDATTGRLLETLPVRVAWSGSVPLLMDAQAGMLYLPVDHGQLLLLRDTSASPQALNANTAVALAHGAIAAYLPFTNQDPPFVTPETFLVSGTAQGQTILMTYFIHYSDFQWTKGPYPGMTSTTVTSDAAHPGGFLVTFTITWNETFLRTHSWVCAVAPDGSVTLRSDTGDLVP